MTGMIILHDYQYEKPLAIPIDKITGVGLHPAGHVVVHVGDHDKGFVVLEDFQKVLDRIRKVLTHNHKLVEIPEQRCPLCEKMVKTLINTFGEYYCIQCLESDECQKDILINAWDDRDVCDDEEEGFWCGECQETVEKPSEFHGDEMCAGCAEEAEALYKETQANKALNLEEDKNIFTCECGVSTPLQERIEYHGDYHCQTCYDEITGKHG